MQTAFGGSSAGPVHRAQTGAIEIEVAHLTLPVGYRMGAPVRRGLVFCAGIVIDVGVTTNPVRPGHAPGGQRPGAQPGSAGSADATSTAARAPGAPGTPDGFETALRGYDRNQVDARIAELSRQLAAAGEHNRAIAARLAEEQRRAENAERQLRETRASQGKHAAAQPGGNGEGGQGFGYRAERILRMAEAEAHETRSKAAKEATELLERARAEAEVHRHEIEQNLIMRATALDQKANEVSTALREREQAAAAELSSARSEAESVRAQARHEMEQARRNVEIVARDIRAQAERWAEQHRAAVSRDVARLVGLKETLHRDLGAVSENLLAGLKSAERAVDQRPPGEQGVPAAPSPSGAKQPDEAAKGAAARTVEHGLQTAPMPARGQRS
jgi:cell division septum initiation protein DivIVA